MQIQFEVPEEIALILADEPVGLRRAAIEALMLEGLRSGKITTYQARQVLGIASRYEMDGFLKAHGVYLPVTLDQVIEDSELAATFARS